LPTCGTRSAFAHDTGAAGTRIAGDGAGDDCLATRFARLRAAFRLLAFFLSLAPLAS
jgi:hypothetical protein